MEQVPLATISRNQNQNQQQQNKMDGSFAWGLVWFIIISFIVYVILISVKPSWVQSTNADGSPSGNLDASKAILWTIVIAFIISIIIWALYSWSSPATRTVVVTRDVSE